MPFDIAINAGRATSILDQLVVEPLMIALDVVVLRVWPPKGDARRVE